jgi:hypothetical protein
VKIGVGHSSSSRNTAAALAGGWVPAVLPRVS